MTKDQILARIDQIVVSCEKSADPERLVNGALTVMSAVYGPGSHQVQSLLARRTELSKLATGASLRNSLLTDAVKGTMENLREEIEAGLLSSLERRITSDILSDLIQLARAALSESGDGPKNVAAV